jgi:hypothetical protein
MTATVDLSDIVTTMKAEVLTACGNIALDLGAQNSWAGLDPADDALSNAEGTGACDRASQKIETLLDAAGRIDMAVVVSKGECRRDFEHQKQCDQQCSMTTSCDPGSIETRCEASSISVMCAGSCAAEATCVGSPSHAANCMGQCEAECVGECQGVCIHEDGHATENDPNCKGHCSATCKGMCSGLCKIEQPEGLDCGANVHCTGGCIGTATDPVCVSKFTPPSCAVDEQCHEVCTTQVEAHADCDPTQVEVFIDLTTHPELQPLRDTLEENLPPLIDAAEQQGPIALDALDHLSAAGTALANNVEDLDGKSLACTAETATLMAETVDTGEMAANAAIEVKVTVVDRTQ